SELLLIPVKRWAADLDDPGSYRGQAAVVAGRKGGPQASGEGGAGDVPTIPARLPGVRSTEENLHSFRPAGPGDRFRLALRCQWQDRIPQRCVSRRHRV